MITVLTVNYNTPDFIGRLVKTFRMFYNLLIVIIDGSDQDNYLKIKHLTELNIEIHHFDYNIHHGPGLAYGFNYIKTDKILVLDSDLFVVNNGFVEDLDRKLKPESYGIGDIQITDRNGWNTKRGLKYLHPACMLINREVALKYPMPIKHGAPMIETMRYLHDKKLSYLLQHEPWVANDFRNKEKIFVSHPWQGTVKRTGGYNL